MLWLLLDKRLEKLRIPISEVYDFLGSLMTCALYRLGDILDDDVHKKDYHRSYGGNDSGY